LQDLVGYAYFVFMSRESD